MSVVVSDSQSDERRMLADAVAGFVRSGSGVARARALKAGGVRRDRDAWAQMAELGWLGIAVPEAAGGLGLGAGELAVVAQGLGGELLAASAAGWPAEHGGVGLSPAKQLIFTEEQERIGVARAPDQGVIMVGPLLIRYGTAEQREKYLPKILSWEHIWCQGYSEPNAGSDLASLATRAEDDGDHWVVNGQKTWTTLAQDATHMFLLARADAHAERKQQGISFLLVDLDTPGIAIRPIENIAGHEEFCEIFFDNVRVPKENLVGEPNQGWTMAKALLGFERLFLGSPKQSQNAIGRLDALATARGLHDDPAFSDAFTTLQLDVADLSEAYESFAAQVRAGEALGADVSWLKIWATETFGRIAELALQAADSEAPLVAGQIAGAETVDVMSLYFSCLPTTIYGGSNEIQRNILAKQVLRLPG